MDYCLDDRPQKSPQFSVTDVRYVYRNKWTSVRIDSLCLQSGEHTEYAVIERPNYVQVIAMDEEGRFLLVRQFRYPVSGELYEFPCGGLNEGESALDAAARELLEETGYAGENFRQLGTMFEVPGLATQSAHVFVCTAKRVSTPKPEALEIGIEVVSKSLIELGAMVRSGDLRDGPTIAALGLYLFSEGGLS